MSDFEDVKPYTQAELDQQAIWANEFDQWWESEGQYQRAGGGQYERTFAWWAWLNREQKQQAIIDDLKAQLECCRKENAVLLGKVGELEKNEFLLARVKTILGCEKKTNLLESIIVRDLRKVLRGEHD